MAFSWKAKEIHNLRSAVNPPEFQGNYGQRNQQGNRGMGGHNLRTNVQRNEPRRQDHQNHYMNQNDDIQRNQYEQNHNHEQNAPEKIRTGHRENTGEGRHKMTIDDSTMKQPVQSRQIVNIDEQVIPVLRNKKNEFNIPEREERGNVGGGYLNAEDISSDKMARAGPLSHFIGESLCKGIFSKNWNYRDDALNTLRGEIIRGSSSEIINFDDQAGLFVSVFGAVANTIKDRISKVGECSMELLKSLLECIHPPSVAGNPEFKSYVDDVLLALMIKIGDNKHLNQELGESNLMNLCDCDDVGPYIITNLLVKTHGLPKVVNDFRHLSTRLRFLKKMAQKYGVSGSTVPLLKIIDFAVKNLDNSNAGVRKNSVELIVEVMKISGAKSVTPLLEGIRKNQMELITRGHNKALGLPEDSEMQNEMDRGDQRGRAQNSNPNKKSNEETKVCEFCGRFDKHLLNSQKYDMHLWKECPMLTTCKDCALVVEISTLIEHRLEECDNKTKYMECPRCKEAVENNVYNEHIENKTCLPSVSLREGNRCPLCHENIGPEVAGWKRHLVLEGCPNNERTLN